MIEVEQIKGGWKNVPENLKTKTQLRKLGLKPIDATKPRAEVWSCEAWCKLYDIHTDTKPKKQLSEKQQEALQNMQKARIDKRTCDYCHELESSFKHMDVDKTGKKMCRKCQWETEQAFYEARGRQLAQETFGEWIKEDFYVMDLETATREGEVIELSIIDLEGKVLFNQLIKPFGPLSRETQLIHGITEEELQDKPTFKEVYPQLKPLLEEKLLLSFDELYDRPSIFKSCENWGLPLPELQTDCVMRAYSDYVQSELWVSLEEASQDWTTHRTEKDCQNILKIINRVWKELGLTKDEMAQ